MGGMQTAQRQGGSACHNTVKKEACWRLGLSEGKWGRKWQTAAWEAAPTHTDPLALEPPADALERFLSNFTVYNDSSRCYGSDSVWWPVDLSLATSSGSIIISLASIRAPYACLSNAPFVQVLHLWFQSASPLLCFLYDWHTPEMFVLFGIRS